MRGGRREEVRRLVVGEMEVKPRRSLELQK